jgi:uncharacterized membrane protein
MVLSTFLLVRFIFAALLAVVLPGAMLVLLLFPRARFDGVERMFLILSTSVATSSLVAIALTMTPTGLQAWSFTLAILVLSTLMGIGAAARHGGWRNTSSTVSDAVRYAARWPRTLGRRTVEFPLFMVVLIVLVGLGLGRGESATRVTEFYFPPEHLPALLSQSAQAPLEVPLEIANGAEHAASFRIEVWRDDARIAEQNDITVDGRGVARTTIAVPAPTDGEEHDIEFRLLSAAQPDPVALLRLQRGVPNSDNAARQ